MMMEFLVKSENHSRYIKAGSAEVAAKRFLNYLRRYTEERPKTLTIMVAQGMVKPCGVATVEWYTGKLRNAVLGDAQGEWWDLKLVQKSK